MQSDEQLCRRALEGAAQLVELYGEEFLPLFLRLEEELEKALGQRTAVDRALALARKGGRAA